VDPVWTVWRHNPTGGAVGYIPEGGYAVTFENPLCEPDQILKVIKAYLKYIKRERHLKPVWCCVGEETEQHLTQGLGWSAIVAVAEERLNPTELSMENDRNLRKKIHRAEREGVKLHTVEGEPNTALKEKVEKKA